MSRARATAGTLLIVAASVAAPLPAQTVTTACPTVPGTWNIRATAPRKVPEQAKSLAPAKADWLYKGNG